MSEAPAILLIEDEAHTRALLQVTICQAGYQFIHAATGAAGISATFDQEPSIVLLDLGLPDVDGLEVTRRIRERSRVPIIVVSARSQEAQKIAALDGGANDYIMKPFATGELLARIRVGLRSLAPARKLGDTGVLVVGDLAVDFDTRRVTVAGDEVKLTPIEYRLLVVMMRSNGRVLTHQQILRQVWGPRFVQQMNYLRVYMKKLRYKIEPEPARPKYLLNEPGIGYRLRMRDC